MQKIIESGKIKKFKRISKGSCVNVLAKLSEVDDEQVFISELEQFEEVIQANNLSEMRKLLLLNFLKRKLEEINTLISIGKAIFAEQLENRSGITETSFVKLDKIVLVKQLIIRNVLALAKSKKETKSKKICAKILNNGNSLINQQISTIAEEEIIAPNYINYKFRVFYQYGSESTPQIININLTQDCDLKTMCKEIKKSLGIFEFAKFNIYINENNTYESLSGIGQLNTKDYNYLKLVPI
jgi:hypothetical protein